MNYLDVAKMLKIARDFYAEELAKEEQADAAEEQAILARAGQQGIQVGDNYTITRSGNNVQVNGRPVTAPTQPQRMGTTTPPATPPVTPVAQPPTRQAVPATKPVVKPPTAQPAAPKPQGPIVNKPIGNPGVAANRTRTMLPTRQPAQARPAGTR